MLAARALQWLERSKNVGVNLASRASRRVLAVRVLPARFSCVRLAAARGLDKAELRRLRNTLAELARRLADYKRAARLFQLCVDDSRDMVAAQAQALAPARLLKLQLVDDLCHLQEMCMPGQQLSMITICRGGHGCSQDGILGYSAKTKTVLKTYQVVGFVQCESRSPCARPRTPPLTLRRVTPAVST